MRHRKRLYSSYIKKINNKIKRKLNKSSMTNDDLHDLFHYYDMLMYFDYYNNYEYYKRKEDEMRQEVKNDL